VAKNDGAVIIGVGILIWILSRKKGPFGPRGGFGGGGGGVRGRTPEDPHEFGPRGGFGGGGGGVR
jgi:hypothetical protein